MTSILLLVSSMVYSQKIPNASLEHWIDVRTNIDGKRERYSIPIGWVKSSGTVVPRSVEGGFFDDVHDGDTSMVLFNTGLDEIPSKVSTTFAHNERSRHFSFWSKTGLYENMSFYVKVEFFKKNGEMVAEKSFESDARYRAINEELRWKFQENFLILDYYSEDRPDSARITFTSARKEDLPSNSLLFIDSLSFSPYSVGVNEVPQSTNPYWTISPNPTNGSKVFIDYRLIKNSQIRITDLLGKTLYTSELEELAVDQGRLTLYLKEFQSGTYFVTVYNNEMSYSQKMIVTN